MVRIWVWRRVNLGTPQRRTGRRPSFSARWFVYDSDLGVTHKRFNWSLVLGFVLAMAVSACFWSGVGLTITRVWK
ncbi:MAG: hypothetical protein WAM69_04330 [Candidatus Sulfotelmatobacter sp.]